MSEEKVVVLVTHWPVCVVADAIHLSYAKILDGLQQVFVGHQIPGVEKGHSKVLQYFFRPLVHI